MANNLLVFDLDGTLSDPKEGIVRSINYSLVRHGYKELPESELLKYIGPPIDQSFARLIGVEEPREIESLVGSYRERYASVGFSENAIYKGIPQALEQLKDSGSRLGVCTSKRRDFAEKILEMFGIRGYFTFVDGGDIGISKGQQLGELIRKGVITPDSIMIGDRDVDLLAAHKNGMPSAGVLWGYGSAKELSRENPRYLLESPYALLSLLEGPL